MKKIDSLETVNRLIYALSIFGGLFTILYAADPGDGQPANPTLIVFGVAALILSTLTYRLVDVFAFHVRKSHS
jgi:hypothetical protein